MRTRYFIQYSVHRVGVMHAATAVVYTHSMLTSAAVAYIHRYCNVVLTAL
jgi:hypothetical protein